MCKCKKTQDQTVTLKEHCYCGKVGSARCLEFVHQHHINVLLVVENIWLDYYIKPCIWYDQLHINYNAKLVKLFKPTTLLSAWNHYNNNPYISMQFHHRKKLETRVPAKKTCGMCIVTSNLVYLEGHILPTTRDCIL